MKGLFKKALVLALAAMMLLATATTVMAANEMTNMVFAGYDTTDWSNPNKIYNEVYDGKLTGKTILVPVTPTWKFEGYEAAYPYAGYSAMYLEGNKQDIYVYNNLFPQWETRRQDYMWEIKAPYYIYERQQTKVNNQTWTWDFGNAKFNIPDTMLMTKTVKTAVVVNTEWKNYGFGKYAANGKPLTNAEVAMYNTFGAGSAITDWNAAVANNLTAEKLSAKDEYNRYVVTDAEIAAMVDVVNSKYITAKFNTYNDDGLLTKNVAAEYLAHANDGWAWDSDTLAFGTGVKVEWTQPSFELCEPYRQYQCLIVNGVVMDGTNGKDYIYRYTGGLATPEVKWDFYGFEVANDGLYNVVEKKFVKVDGVFVPGVDANGNEMYRRPTGKYGKGYFVVKDAENKIEHWVTDYEGHTINDAVLSCDNGNVSSAKVIEAYIAANANGAILTDIRS